jgi:hypothetical protein
LINANLVQVFPLAFIAKSDEDSAVAALWGEIWEEGTTSISAALRMYMADLVPLITAGTPFTLHAPSVHTNTRVVYFALSMSFYLLKLCLQSCHQSFIVACIDEQQHLCYTT